MAAVFQQKDNLWREFLNPLRGLTMERIVQLVEQGERGAFADLQWFYQAMERSDALIATVRTPYLGEVEVTPFICSDEPTKL